MWSPFVFLAKEETVSLGNKLKVEATCQELQPTMTAATCGAPLRVLLCQCTYKPEALVGATAEVSLTTTGTPSG